MFRSSGGLFSEIACPLTSQCRLPHCLFKHASLARQVSTIAPAQTSTEQNTQRLSPDSTLKRSVERAVTPPLKKQKPDEKVDDIFKPSVTPSQPTSAITDSPILVMPLTSRAPAPLPQRRVYVQALATTLRRVSLSKTPNRDASLKEHEIAGRTTTATYTNTIKQYIASLSKQKASITAASAQNEITDERILDHLSSLVHDTATLEANQYMVRLPTEEEVAEAKRASESGYETCRRCTRHFKIGGEGLADCIYHWGKLYVAGTKTKKIKKYTCCGEAPGTSAGCTTYHEHVWSTSHPPLQAALIPFKSTTGIGTQFPIAVSLDCEMAYTTLGTELIRLTILDFPSHKRLYDTLVIPGGRVIDLNSQFSGITSIDDPETPSLNTVRDIVLQKYIGADTVIVGHGLENDVTAMRIFHKRYVDSAILYRFASPFKPALKTLVEKHLDRIIQAPNVTVTGNENSATIGHDSLEDALGAADLVIKYITRRLNQMKNKMP
ncbi:hypothetical protein V1512DRAFT_258850 [Lipomyces arxii]|uniref:uncharacterized protein n=1 Tax=Lipomyces arxii TaxID=56418 RepID=UPI0034CE3F65